MKRGFNMAEDKEFNTFQNIQEKLDYLHKYKLLAATKTDIPKYIYRSKSAIFACEIIGYKANYDTFSITTIDFGNGPHFIHSDYLREMQKGISNLQADAVTPSFIHRQKPAEERKKGKLLSTLPDSYIIFDLETTNLNIYEAEIIQIAALRIQDNEIIDTFCSYVRPNNPIPDSVTKLTGITDLDVCMAPDIETILPKFLEYIGDQCLAGYNIHSYDTNLLFDIAESCFNVSISNDYFDFYLFFKSVIPKAEINGYKLTDIAEYYDIDTSSAHTALTDCNLCLESYKCFIGNKNTSISLENINVINTEFEKRLFLHLQEIIATEELPENSLYLYSNRSNKGDNKNKKISKSICIHEPEYPPIPNSQAILGKNYVILKIIQDNGKVELTIRPMQCQEVSQNLVDVEIKEKVNGKGQTKEFNILFDECHPQLMDYIIKNVFYCLKNYRSSASFSCCSRFTACSDALKCVHENKLYATGCTYRRNLENGRIFYGKNRNIDSQ